jgi:hypothetical protein
VHFEILEVEVFNSKFPHIKNMKREGGIDCLLCNQVYADKHYEKKRKGLFH